MKGFELIFEVLKQYFGIRGSKIIICLVLIAFGIKNSEIKSKTGVSYDALRKYTDDRIFAVLTIGIFGVCRNHPTSVACDYVIQPYLIPHSPVFLCVLSRVMRKRPVAGSIM